MRGYFKGLVLYFIYKVIFVVLVRVKDLERREVVRYRKYYNVLGNIKINIVRVSRSIK